METKLREWPFAQFLFNNPRSSWIWLIIRLYVGWQWLEAGWGKLGSPAWTGNASGTALQGFINGALQKMTGAHPDVQGWYGSFLQNVVLPQASLWAHLVTYGELFVGVALILGIFTGIAAFFGLTMNFSYLLAGTVSTNPILFILGVGMMFAWKVAGNIGLDRWVLSRLGTPWQKGTLFQKDSAI